MRFKIANYFFYRCAVCNHTFVWPPPDEVAAAIYDDDYFRGARGVVYPDYIADGPLLRERGRRYGELLRRFGDPGSALDVGAAAGFFSQGLRDLGWRTVGLDPNASMTAFARANGLDVRSGELEQFESAEPFEAIMMIQVAAHFRDLRAALERAAAVTRPGGLWLFETWNAASLNARLFGAAWHAYAPPSTLRAFSPRSLDIAAARFGFARLARGRAWKPLSGSHAKAILARLSSRSRLARGAATLARMLPDRAVIQYPLGDAFWALYRKG